MEEIGSVEKFEEMVKAKEKFGIVFGATWCGACGVLKSAIGGTKFESLMVFADVDNLPELSDKYEVTKLPHCVFLFNGEVVDVFTGSSFDEFQTRAEAFVVMDTVSRFVVPKEDVGGQEPIIPHIASFGHDFCGKVKVVNRPTHSISFEMLKAVGLGGLKCGADDVDSLNAVVDTVFCRPEQEWERPTWADIEQLFSYRVPTISLDGTCSNIHQLAKEPFNLATSVYHVEYSAESLASSPSPWTLRLQRLKEIVLKMNEIVGADWVGIYRLMNAGGTPTLVKESYIGEPSRPLFPVTEEFAKKSTNSWVALTGNVRVIDDTRQREEGVSYYECSGSVRSEMCAPIWRPTAEGHLEVIGIVDLESWKQSHFDSKKVLEVLKVCLDLGKINLGV